MPGRAATWHPPILGENKPGQTEKQNLNEVLAHQTGSYFFKGKLGGFDLSGCAGRAQPQGRIK